MKEDWNRISGIYDCLKTALQPTICEVIDDSEAHYGHAGTMDGAGHYNITVVAEIFEGLSLVKRHQSIYKALEGWMGPEIHALQIRAHTPKEWSQRANIS